MADRASAMPETNGLNKVDAARCELQRANSPTQNLDIISLLRYVQAFIPLGAALMSIGATLVCVGVCWGSLQLLRHHPHLLAIATGMVFLLAGIVANPNGLLIFLPKGAQDLLLKSTLFDFLHDDADLTNAARRWGRILLLCFTTNEDDVAEIVEGMDPDFVYMVFRKRMIDFVPRGVKRLLLPENQIVLPERRTAIHTRSKSSKADPDRAEPAIRATPLLRGPANRLEEGIEHLTPTVISRLIIEKKEEIQERIVEPSMRPVMVSLYGPRRLVYNIGMHALQAVSAFGAAYWWGVSAMPARFPRAQSLLLQGLSLLASAPIFSLRGHRRDALMARSSTFATMLGVLSAGFGLALLAYSRRAGPFRLRRSPPPQRTGG